MSSFRRTRTTKPRGRKYPNTGRRQPISKLGALRKLIQEEYEHRAIESDVDYITVVE